MSDGASPPVGHLASDELVHDAAAFLRDRGVFVELQVTQLQGQPAQATGLRVRFAQCAELLDAARDRGWTVHSTGTLSALVFLAPGQLVRVQTSPLDVRETLPVAAQALLDVRAQVVAGGLEDVSSWSVVTEAAQRLDSSSVELARVRAAIASRIEQAWESSSFGVLPAVSPVAGTLAVLLENQAGSGYVTPMAAATTCTFCAQFADVARSFHESPDVESVPPTRASALRVAARPDPSARGRST